jgi:WD40 repeat protein
MSSGGSGAFSDSGIPVIPDYELIRLIGRGGYGDVWIAKGLTGVFRAIKIVWRERFQDAQPFDREFRGLREFAAISLIEPRQLALLHVGRNDSAGFFHYVMELADDANTGREINPAEYVPKTLRELRKQRGRVPAAECLSIGVELARGLGCLHARGLVHRDIKPSNVIFVGGAPKLADIGLVSAAGDAMTFVGTEGFVPPEGPGSPAADVYSLGKLLYELATGQDRNEFPCLPPDLDKNADRVELLELNEVILRACEPDLNNRHKDAAVLLDELLLLQAGKSVRRLRLAERRLGRALRTAAILGIVATVAGVGAWIERTRLATETERRRQAEARLEDLARKTFYSATLSRAQHSLEAGDFGAARAALSAANPGDGEPDLRGFEWKVLWDEAAGDPAKAVRGNGHSLEKLCFSPDGRVLAAQSDDDRTTLRDAETLGDIRTIAGTHRLAGFSSDGKWLVGSDRRFALQRWRVADGQPDTMPAPRINRPILAAGTNNVFAVTGDSVEYVSALREWDFRKRADEFLLPLALEDYSSWSWGQAVSITPDQRMFAITFFHTKAPKFLWRLQVYDVERRALIRDEQGMDRITSVSLSSNGQSMAIADADKGEVSVRELRSNKLCWRRPIDMSIVQTLAFSPRNNFLAIGGREPRLQIVDAETGATVKELHGQDSGIANIIWSKYPERVYSSGTSGDLRLWAVDSPDIRREIVGLWAQALGTQYACLSDDGALLAANSSDDRIQVYNARTLLPIGSGFNGYVPLALDSGGQTLLALTKSGTLKRYSIADGASSGVVSILPSDSSIACANLSANGRFLVASDTVGNIHFWDLDGRMEIASKPANQGRITWSAISDDGESAITAGSDLTVKCWSFRTGQMKAAWPYIPRANNGSFSRDRHWLALCFRNGDVEIRDLTSLHVERRFKTDASVLESVSFSPDCSRLFCGGSSGEVEVYETKDWRPITTLFASSVRSGGDPTVASIAVSADNNALVAYRGDGVLRIWSFLR